MWYDRQGEPLAPSQLGSEEWQMEMKQVEKLLADPEYRVVLQQYTPGKKYFVSTVWLGLDHNFSGGIPIIFETMVFSAKLNKEGYRDSHEQERYATEVEARKGHKKLLVKYSKEEK